MQFIYNNNCFVFGLVACDKYLSSKKLLWNYVNNKGIGDPDVIVGVVDESVLCERYKGKIYFLN